MNILITGGAGFIGTNSALYFAQKGWNVIVYDNLSRSALLGKKVTSDLNWHHLSKHGNITLVDGDILNYKELSSEINKVDAVIHAAAQTAVTTSMTNPTTDFKINALGTFNVLEACRCSPCQPSVVYCSTNKVYGENVNKVDIEEKGSRYAFDDEEFTHGIPENLGIDLCEHTPYGCSKLAGDIYAQDYARLYGLKVGVFRMSCIYGPHQFGVEDQGWVAWFTIAALLGKPITIYGDGKLEIINQPGWPVWHRRTQ